MTWSLAGNIKGPTGTTGQSGGAGGRELAYVEVADIYNLPTRDSTWYDIPGMSFVVPANIDFYLDFNITPRIKIDGATAGTSVNVEIRVVDNPITAAFAYAQNLWWITAAVASGTNSFMQTNMVGSRRVAALAAQTTMKLQMRAAAGAISLVGTYGISPASPYNMRAWAA